MRRSSRESNQMALSKARFWGLLYQFSESEDFGELLQDCGGVSMLL